MTEFTEDPARLRRLVAEDIGIDVPGLLLELESIPKKIHAEREKIAPLKAELAMLQARYEAKAQQPSHYDVERRVLLSELKEEERIRYRRNPEVRTDAKGQEKPVELTDGRAEDLAHASPRYRKFVEEAGAERRRIAELGAQVGAIYDRLEVWKGRKEFLLQKIEHAKALTFAWSAECRLTPH